MRRPFVLAFVCLFAASACDREVGAGQVLVLAMRELVLGFEKPTAVSVQPGGAVIVEDADVLGRGLALTAANPSPDERSTGIGILSNGGSVKVVKGLVAGGNAAILEDASDGQAAVPRFLAPGIVAQQSTVEILGGTVRSGGLSIADGVTLFGSFFQASSVVSVSESVLRIRGGTLEPAPMPDPQFVSSVMALRSDVEISGGDFPSLVALSGSRARILGGRLDALNVAAELLATSPFRFGPGCTEIRGGSFRSVSVGFPGQRLIIFGTDFNRPLGPVAPPLPGATDPRIILAPPAVFALSGTLESGEAFAFELQVRGGAEATLAAPSSPGCP